MNRNRNRDREFMENVFAVCLIGMAVIVLTAAAIGAWS